MFKIHDTVTTLVRGNFAITRHVTRNAKRKDLFSRIIRAAAPLLNLYPGFFLILYTRRRDERKMRRD